MGFGRTLVSSSGCCLEVTIEGCWYGADGLFDAHVFVAGAQQRFVKDFIAGQAAVVCCCIWAGRQGVT